MKTSTLIDVRCAADCAKIPPGFFICQSEERTTLGYNASTFGILWAVPKSFSLGGLFVKLDQPVASLPIVKLLLAHERDGAVNVGGHTLRDTEAAGWNGDVIYDRFTPNSRMTL